MKKYAPKSKNQSFMSKLSLCSSFFFLKFGFMSSLLFFPCQSFHESQKIELKMQLTLVSKKRNVLDFEDMKNTLRTNSSIINSLESIQS